MSPQNQNHTLSTNYYTRLNQMVTIDAIFYASPLLNSIFISALMTVTFSFILYEIIKTYKNDGKKTYQVFLIGFAIVVLMFFIAFSISIRLNFIFILCESIVWSLMGMLIYIILKMKFKW